MRVNGVLQGRLNSTFSGNSASEGGGINTFSGTVTITNSTFSGNSAVAGGVGSGIWIGTGAVTISNSTFSSNSALWGGGIYNVYSTLTITNSTFSGNSAGYGGGIFINAGAVTITNSTFSGNGSPFGGSGGGIDNWGSSPVTLRNTIVANSTSSANCFGTIINGGNNIDDGMSCGWWGTASGSMSGTDPLLGPLANNGGPTQTFALLAGSPAIDGVTSTPPNGAPSTDQRGVARPQGVRYDIGAYETTRQLGPNFVVNTNADTDDGACETVPAGDCTLREAINAANAATGVNTITFSISGTISLGSTLPIITDTAGLTIDGIGQKVIISGNKAVQVMQVSNYSIIDVPLTLNHLTIADGYSGGGGGIHNMGTLTIANSTLSGNAAEWWGGGIYNSAGILTITNSTFAGNISTSGGGGIYTSEGIVNIINSTFSANSGVDYDGGGSGIFNNMGSVTLRNTIIAKGPSGRNCSGAFINGGNNIDDGTSCGLAATDGSMSSTNPLLGALANNGGPTKTFALLTGSPAVNAVTFNVPNSAPSTDQRGVARPRGAGYDIGAYERNVPDLTPILMLLLDWGGPGLRFLEVQRADQVVGRVQITTVTHARRVDESRGGIVGDNLAVKTMTMGAINLAAILMLRCNQFRVKMET